MSQHVIALDQGTTSSRAGEEGGDRRTDPRARVSRGLHPAGEEQAPEPRVVLIHQKGALLCKAPF